MMVAGGGVTMTHQVPVCDWGHLYQKHKHVETLFWLRQIIKIVHLPLVIADFDIIKTRDFFFIILGKKEERKGEIGEVCYFFSLSTFFKI